MITPAYASQFVTLSYAVTGLLLGALLLHSFLHYRQVRRTYDRLASSQTDGE